MPKKTRKTQAAKVNKMASQIRGFLYDAHNLEGFEIPVAWAEQLADSVGTLLQVAKAYTFGKPELPDDLDWYYTTGKHSPLSDGDERLPF